MRVTLVQKHWGGDHQKRQRLQGVAPSCISYILRAFQSTTTMRHKRKRSSLLMRLVFAHRASQTYLTPSPDATSTTKGIDGHRLWHIMTSKLSDIKRTQNDSESEWHQNWKVSKVSDSNKRMWPVAFPDSQACPVGVFTQTGECYSCVKPSCWPITNITNQAVLFGLFQNVDAFVVCSPWSCLVSFGVVKKEIISCNFWNHTTHSQQLPSGPFMLNRIHQSECTQNILAHRSSYCDSRHCSL